MKELEFKTSEFPTRAKLAEELEKVVLSPKNPSKVLQIVTSLTQEIRTSLFEFLRNNINVFAWSYDDMSGIDPNIIVHQLNVDSNFKLVFQKRRTFNEQRHATIEDEV